MNTTRLRRTGKRIHSIAYFGTYASGKLLAGEVYGPDLLSHRAHLVHRFTDHLPRPLLVPSTQTHYRRCGSRSL